MSSFSRKRFSSSSQESQKEVNAPDENDNESKPRKVWKQSFEYIGTITSDNAPIQRTLTTTGLDLTQIKSSIIPHDQLADYTEEALLGYLKNKENTKHGLKNQLDKIQREENDIKLILSEIDKSLQFAREQTYKKNGRRELQQYFDSYRGDHDTIQRMYLLASQVGILALELSDTKTGMTNYIKEVEALKVRLRYQAPNEERESRISSTSYTSYSRKHQY